MIDLRAVIVGSLWIGGLALLLTTLSYSDWVARQRGESFQAVLDRSPAAWGFNLGLLLVVLGLFDASRGVIGHIVWLALLLLVLGRWWATRRHWPRSAVGAAE